MPYFLKLWFSFILGVKLGILLIGSVDKLFERKRGEGSFLKQKALEFKLCSCIGKLQSCSIPKSLPLKNLNKKSPSHSPRSFKGKSLQTWTIFAVFLEGGELYGLGVSPFLSSPHLNVNSGFIIRFLPSIGVENSYSPVDTHTKFA